MDKDFLTSIEISDCAVTAVYEMKCNFIKSFNVTLFNQNLLIMNVMDITRDNLDFNCLQFATKKMLVKYKNKIFIICFSTIISGKIDVIVRSYENEEEAYKLYSHF